MGWGNNNSDGGWQREEVEVNETGFSGKNICRIKATVPEQGHETTWVW